MIVCLVLLKKKKKKTCKTVFPNGSFVSHSFQPCMSAAVSPHLCRHLLVATFFITVILVAVKWYLTVILILISLINNDIDIFLCACHLYILYSEMSPHVFYLFSFFFISEATSVYNTIFINGYVIKTCQFEAYTHI